MEMSVVLHVMNFQVPNGWARWKFRGSTKLLKLLIRWVISKQGCHIGRKARITEYMGWQTDTAILRRA